MSPTGSPNTQRKTKRSTPKRKMNILFTCVGRRVELLEAFRRAAKKLKLKFEAHGADISWLAPAMHHVDKGHIVPRLDDPKYIDKLLAIVRRQKIDMVIPLIDSELLIMSRAWDRFDRLGCYAVVSSENVIQTCQDKMLTYRMLRAAGIPAPATWACDDLLQRKRHRFPYFMKPREGSAGMGNYVINNLDELKVLSRRVPDPIVQEFIHGVEHTLDVYTGFDGIPRCIVPRRRLEVRNGEVSKGMIVKDRRVMAVGRNVALALGDVRGVITVQCMIQADGQIRVIEINPRLGGGAPLAIHAGADFPLWLMAERLGRPITVKPTAFKSNIVMLRFDESVFCPASRARS